MARSQYVTDTLASMHNCIHSARLEISENGLVSPTCSLKPEASGATVKITSPGRVTLGLTFSKNMSLLEGSRRCRDRPRSCSQNRSPANGAGATKWITHRAIGTAFYPKVEVNHHPRHCLRSAPKLPTHHAQCRTLARQSIASRCAPGRNLYSQRPRAYAISSSMSWS